MQRGVSLLESMVAILILSLGVLSFLSMQLRTLSDTQTSVRRAQAIRLIEDLSERLKVNPNALGDIDKFAGNWQIPASPSQDCNMQACSKDELALWDNYQWRASVGDLLPGGMAAVFYASGESVASNRRQLGVMLGWRENEASTEDDYMGPIDTSTGDGNISCPENFVCHLQYIPVSARCAPYFMGGAKVHFYCPNG